MKKSMKTIQISKETIIEAILSANKKIDEEKEEEFKLSSSLIRTPLVFLFISTGVAFILLAISLIINIFYGSAVNDLPDGMVDKIIFYIIYFPIAIFIFILGIGFFKASSEIKKVKDQNILIAYFSAITSVIALVVSIISINK